MVRFRWVKPLVHAYFVSFLKTEALHYVFKIMFEALAGGQTRMIIMVSPDLKIYKFTSLDNP